MTPIILIPARMAATRLPGKPLIPIRGVPLIVHVLRRAMEAEIGRVAVACDGEEIAAVVRAAGGEAVVTDPDLPSGSDRISQALEKLDPAGDHDAVINVQGDLPTIAPASIRASLVPLENTAVDISTLVAEITDPEEKVNPNVVKCVGSMYADGLMRALYFTRATAPWGEGPLYHHIGLYAYRREALARFVTLPPSTLEKREKLEQLRALEAGMRIDAARVTEVPLGVDTPADVAHAERMLAAGASA
ncbi:3-deoxy-manno-octulosonate cytidylyltransferase [Acuticoccus kandeliae]|uniref:3-deoxy-manno-octulosonate cytidylyltransferase n=1 Tax=Acuticoccus kandeliae TaxID=2073160 RepID=UPI00196AC944|nr:3-deoxy-manno-octulosonate cytidylyltransferase [Acuticoccus kandeliae]